MSETNETPEEFEPVPDEVPDDVESRDTFEPESVESPIEAQQLFGSNEIPENFITETNGVAPPFGRDPVDMICPECGATMTTQTSSEISTLGFDSNSCFYACLMCCLSSSVSGGN